MRSRRLSSIQPILLLCVLAIPVGLGAQEQNPRHHHYKLIDLGTLGGPQSWVFGSHEVPAATLNNEGVVIGVGNTADSNPNYSYPCNPFGTFLCALFGMPDPFTEHAIQFENGALTDLGVLPGGYNSTAMWISTNGRVVGVSENGIIDPLAGYPEGRAVFWKQGHPVDLKTFGGNESAAFSVNNQGQVVGGATDASNNGRAFLWTEDRGLTDLGTLGASSALATLINERGQVTGVSALCDTCNQDTFFWEGGTMQRIPDFGGPLSFPNEINNRGQVVGQSDLPGGENAHGFLWEKGVLTDLGTLPGGTGSGARWINEAGAIVGVSQNGAIYHAVLWKHGKISDLGTIDPCSIAQSINSASQIVGESENCDGIPLHAFLWENGGPIVDLNTLISPGSGLTLTLAVSINDRGEIAGQATNSAGDNHAFLLVPCDENHIGVEACEYSIVEASAASPEPLAIHESPKLKPPSTFWRQNNRSRVLGVIRPRN